MPQIKSFDPNMKVPEPSFWLAKPNKEIIGKLKHIYNHSMNLRLKDMDELRFNIPLQLEDEYGHYIILNENADKIREQFLIRVDYDGTLPNTQWFKINQMTKSSSDSGDEFSISCFSLESELRGKKLFNYAAESQNCNQVLTVALQGTLWTIDYIDPTYNTTYRDFEVNGKSAVDFIYSDIVETFSGCLPVFDTVNRKVSIYKDKNIGSNKGLRIKYDKNMESISKDSQTDELTTRLYPVGSEDLTINRVNPNGQEYIDDFSYFLQPYKDARSLKFDGLDDYVTVPHSTSISISSEVTIEMCIKRSELKTGFETILNKRGGGVCNYELFLNSTDKRLGFFSSGSILTFAYVPPINESVHIACVTNATTSTLYVNGVNMGTIAKGIGTTNTAPLLIGGFSGQYFMGDVWDIRIWNASRTQSEILNNMNSKLNGNETGLVGYWEFNEGKGTITYDSSANSNHGTISGGPTWSINTIEPSAYFSNSLAKSMTTYTNLISKLSPVDDIAEIGTSPTVVKMANHGLIVGDYIVNRTVGREIRRVNSVTDANTIHVLNVTNQTTGDEILKYKDGRFGKLLFQYEDLQRTKSSKEIELSTLMSELRSILDVHEIQKGAYTMDNKLVTISNTSTTRTLSNLNAAHKYVVMARISTSAGTTVTVNSVNRSFTANQWSVLAKVTGVTSHTVTVTTSQSGVTINTLIIRITDDESLNTMPNPSTPPALASQTNVGSTLSPGTYYVSYAWTSSAGVTLVSPESSMVITSGNQLALTLPFMPTGATGTRIYMGTTPTVGTLQATVTQTSYVRTTPITAGAAKPSSNTATYNNNADLILKYSDGNKQVQIDAKNAEISTTNNDITNKLAEINNFITIHDYPNNFTTPELDELKLYTFMEEHRDDNIVDDYDLFDAGFEQLSKLNSPTIMYTTTIANFLESISEQKNWDKLNLGDYATTIHNTLGINIKLRIVELEFDFENADVRLVISNDKDVRSKDERAIDVFYDSINTSKKLNAKKSSWDVTKENFNTRNDQISVIPANPIIANDGSALRHVVNNDGSVDIYFSWAFNGSGDQYNIDGFYVYTYASETDSDYTFGSSYSRKDIKTLRAEDREYAIFGVPADKYYTFGVQAFRVVDANVSTNNILLSGIVQPNIPIESPYHPEDEISFGGAISIGGIPASQLADVAENFNSRNDRIATIPANPTILGDGSAIDHTINTDGSTNISFEWNYSGTGNAYNIDGFFVYVYQSATPTAYIFGSNVENELKYNISDRTAFIITGQPANRYYTFGVQAYRIVDDDINSNRILLSGIVKSSVSGENPYLPSSTVAFNGDVLGTVNSVPAMDVSDATAKFNSRNDRIATTPAIPTIASDGSALDHTLNSDGSVDISFEWSHSGSGNAYNIDGFIVYVYQSTTPTAYTFGTTLSAETVYYATSDKRAMILYGVPADKYYTFGVRAYRDVDTDVSSTGRVQSNIAKSNVSGENPFRPESNVAFSGNITGSINGTLASTVVTYANAGNSAWGKFSGAGNTIPSGNVDFNFAGSSSKGGNANNTNAVGSQTATSVQQAVINFNDRNDRNSTTPTNPSIPGSGAAIDHAVNTDGSSNISFEWGFTNGAGANDIDGFIVYMYQSTTPTAYTFGTSPAFETVNYVTPEKRAFIVYGVPTNIYYTFGVQAYRIVDNDINTNGIVKSAIVKSTVSGENPYLPETSVAFSGNITGTVSGTSASTIALATSNFNLRNDRNNVTPAAPTILNDTSAIDHTANSDGSVDISFEWVYSGAGAAYDIDGFIVYRYSSNSSSPYTFGSIPAAEDVTLVTPDKRAVIFSGVPANKHYTFGVRAYRDVDRDIDASSRMVSAIVKSTLTEENPYLPSAVVTFSGDITGTIGGTPYERITKTPATFVIADASTTNNPNRADFIVPLGSLDAHLTINQAINSLPLNGGEIVLLDGTYKIRDSILPFSNVSIKGQGNSTYIFMSNGVATNGMFKNADQSLGNSNIKISNLYMFGNKNWNSLTPTQSGFWFRNVTNSSINDVVISDFRFNGIYLYNSTSNVVSNVTIKSCSTAFCYYQSTNNTISDSNFSSNTGVGLLFEGSSENNRVTGTICSDNTGGALIDHSGYNTFVGCSFSDNDVYGISLSNSNYSTLTGNLINNNGEYGVISQTSKSSTISGNSVHGNGGHGISSAGDSNINISGNSVSGNSKSNNNYFDNIHLFFSSFNSVQNNIVRMGDAIPKPRYGINVYNSSCISNIIANNDLTNSGLSGNISDSGVDTNTGLNSLGNRDFVTTGTVQSATSNSITIKNASATVNGIYNGYNIFIVSGLGSGQSRTITNYVGGTRTATISANWSVIPNNTSVYEVR